MARVAWTAGKVLTVMSLLLGVVCDPMKAADDAMQMTILGVQVRIIMENAKITAQLDETKAKAWVTDMHAASTTGRCPVGLASNVARRLAFALCRNAEALIDVVEHI